VKNFAITTLGCKVNQYESQQIRQLLEGLKLHQLATVAGADLVVVNTCCVTQRASSKSRRHIRKARRLSPDATIVVCGCLPTVQDSESTNIDEKTCAIRHRDDLAAGLSHIVKSTNSDAAEPMMPPCSTPTIRAESSLGIKQKNLIECAAPLPQIRIFKGQTRAFLKVQDGCDGCCSYCIIPQTRPHVRSKPLESALGEARTLARAGHKEIVVTGVFLGAYGQETTRRKSWPNRANEKLSVLLERMVEIPELSRIRLSSMEPADVTPRLLEVMSRYNKIMPHLHLSLQSGSNSVLKGMCRQYTADEFLETVGLIKTRLDRPAISTDIIVGFPGETNADFEQTVQLARHVGFAKMHVFKFSPRKDTPAARMKGAVSKTLVSERASTLRALDEQLGAKFREQFIGGLAQVLVEDSAGKACGRSERYFPVYLDRTRPELRQNELVTARLVENRADGVLGQVISRH
jgi:threonylcarbamoyladenosine tRNA methylthiotransferase MtaB